MSARMSEHTAPAERGDVGPTTEVQLDVLRFFEAASDEDWRVSEVVAASFREKYGEDGDAAKVCREAVRSIRERISAAAPDAGSAGGEEQAALQKLEAFGDRHCTGRPDCPFPHEAVALLRARSLARAALASPAPEAPSGEPDAWAVVNSAGAVFSVYFGRVNAVEMAETVNAQPDAKKTPYTVEPLYRAPVPEQTAETPSAEYEAIIRYAEQHSKGYGMESRLAEAFLALAAIPADRVAEGERHG